MAQPRKAIIAAAGEGTRRYPISRTQDKCMLPILNRPVIDYAIEECVKAGITDILVLTRQGSSQIPDYFNDQGVRLSLPYLDNIKLNFEELDQHGRYGTSIPLFEAQSFVESEKNFIYTMGDDMVMPLDIKNPIELMIERIQDDPDADVGQMAVEIDLQDAPNYGVLEIDENNGLVGIVEKPPVEQAPSNLINVSTYLFTPKVLEFLNESVAQEVDDEYQITSVINDYVQAGNKVLVSRANGRFLDAGKVESWVRANRLMLEQSQRQP